MNTGRVLELADDAVELGGKWPSEALGGVDVSTSPLEKSLRDVAMICSRYCMGKMMGFGAYSTSFGSIYAAVDPLRSLSILRLK